MSLQQLIAAGRAVHGALDTMDAQMAARLEINRTDLRGLNALEGGALTPGELGAKLGLSSGSVTALINRLVKAALVERVASEEDGRSVKVEITKDRFAELAGLYGTCATSIAQTFSGGTHSDLASAADTLQSFAAAIEAATMAIDSCD
ncbi:MAG: MarR family transcriptional regulator [Pseudomonadota bacterium]